MPSQPTCPPADLEAWIADQRGAIAELESALWDGGLNEALLKPYQAAFRELEQLIAAQGEDPRHHFVIAIPVADSPLHLKDCLDSLLELCRAYGYGGQVNGRWRKVAVLLADDSSDAACIAQHREIAREFDQAGLTTHYFGLEEQLALMDRLENPPFSKGGRGDFLTSALVQPSEKSPPTPLWERGEQDPPALTTIVGVHRREAYGHKGQAMMRNIAYLKLAEMFAGDEAVLFYTIDADQEFKVKVATAEGGKEVCAVNFLHRLDEIFSQTDAQILTGKVVGDPPVSPAVMAGNFMEDVIGFLREMAAGEPGQAYRQPGATGGGDAAYHDMADLFGFQQAGDAYRYRCPRKGDAGFVSAKAPTTPQSLPDAPDNAACFSAFSQRLNSFFHGEHPTRITWFQYQDALASVQPARTIYTGNYVFRPEALGWFIPYAPLRLRMSGPTMGRLLKAEMGERFVSANLPMLHKRTVEATGSSEFRPGIVSEQTRVDLCGEFERQFHGDVMLFSMQRLTDLGYPARPLPTSVVAETLESVRGEMREKYRVKQQTILERLGLLTSLLEAPANWWNRAEDLTAALANFRAFIRNIAHNFGTTSPCYARIDAPGNWESWRDRQIAAIQGFHRDRQAWNEALAQL
ncbi:MAG: hypothetical protein Q8O33_14755 [Pseudomonadota bacterium]|nr:hypothetical protein [Pseudomonadota bacterium]